MMLGRYQSRVLLLCRRCYVSPNTRNAINTCHRRRATTHVLKRSSSRCANSSSDTNTHQSNKIRVITKKPYHESTFVAKKSKFVCKIATISNSNEAMKFIKDHSDVSVSHNCFAWRIGDANNRSSDDGEPSGTAANSNPECPPREKRKTGFRERRRDGDEILRRDKVRSRRFDASLRWSGKSSV